MKNTTVFNIHDEYESYIDSDNYVTPNLSYCRNDVKVHYQKQLFKDKYLTFEILSPGTITWKTTNNYFTKTISYSSDGGSTWTDITSNETAQVLGTYIVGNQILVKGTNNRYGTNDQNRHNSFGGTAKVNIYGNIMSLINGDNFRTIEPISEYEQFYGLFENYTNLISAANLILPAKTLIRSCYKSMFAGCSSLTTTPELPATTLALYCYQYMFQNCTLLTTVPTMLPATALANYCYQSMFGGCTLLTTSPELPATTLKEGCYQSMFSNTNAIPDCAHIDFTNSSVVSSGGLRGLFAGTKITDSILYTILPINSETNHYYLPVTTLAQYCYYQMFYGCTSLTTTPELPATTLAQYCYQNMFYGCTSLTTAPTILPATTLEQYCYNNMFYGCTSLTTTPELPATTLANYCYQYMFYGCTLLNYIKCLATNISASNCTNNWVNGVASSGTFVKDASMESWPTGVSGIPSNWTIINN